MLAPYLAVKPAASMSSMTPRHLSMWIEAREEGRIVAVGVVASGRGTPGLLGEIADWAPRRSAGHRRGEEGGGWAVSRRRGCVFGGGLGLVVGWAWEFDWWAVGLCGDFFFCGLGMDELLLWTGDRGVGGFNL